MAKYLLAIDAGTSSVRSLVFDLTGKLVTSAAQEWEYDIPADAAPLGREFAASQFWEIICETIRQTIRKGGLEAADIIGVSATSQREGVVFLDKNGGELYAGPNIDLRALNEGLAMDSEHGDEIYAITGHKPSFMFTPAKLGWFRNNKPEVYKKIATVLSISDWIVYRLCGERASEVCAAGEVGLIDLKTRRWSDRLVSLLDLPHGIYPELVPAGSRVGKVYRKAAGETGLKEGTPIIIGAPDAQSGLLGMGLRERGEVGIVLGWSAPVQMVLDKPLVDPQARTWTGCHVFPGRWVLESSTGETGSVYRWLRDMFFTDSKDGAFEEMDRLALETPPGAGGTLAFIGPTAINMSRLGLRYGGFVFPVPVSATGIGKGHMARAALENLSFALKAGGEQLEAVSGLKINEVSVGGGMLKSACLREMLPAALGMPVHFSLEEVSGLGAAVCAAVGAGVYSNLEEAVGTMAPPAPPTEPEPGAALEYKELYRAWNTVAGCLEKLNEVMK